MCGSEGSPASDGPGMLRCEKFTELAGKRFLDEWVKLSPRKSTALRRRDIRMLKS